MNRKSFVVGFILISVLLVMLVIMRFVLLGGLRVVSLSSAPMFSGQISQSLGPSPNGSFLVLGKDYSLDTHYFDNNTWVVAAIKPLVPTLNSAVAVMKNQAGIYRIVLGPSSSLTTNQIRSLPTDVGDYVSARVAVYAPIP
jgi:hypothetical protein